MYEAVIFPNTHVQIISRSYKKLPCPTCKEMSKCRSTGERQLRSIGLTQPVVLEVHYSKHYCKKCGRYFNAPMDNLAEPGSMFTNEVKKRALAPVFEDQVPLRKTVERMLRDFYVAHTVINA